MACDHERGKGGFGTMSKLAIWSLLLAVVANSGAAAQGQADQDPTHVLVNGALAVPGAPADSQTVPSKYSARNAASDRLSTAAFRLKNLTDDQRREIYEQLSGQRPPLALSPGQADAPYAVVGAEIPAQIALRDFTPLPEALVARIPELHDTVFMRSDGRVLLVAGAARHDQTCPGEMSKTFRLAALAREEFERAGMVCDVLDLSLLTAQYGRQILPCKACVSTAMPLCNWPSPSMCGSGSRMEPACRVTPYSLARPPNRLW